MSGLFSDYFPILQCPVLCVRRRKQLNCPALRGRNTDRITVRFSLEGERKNEGWPENGGLAMYRHGCALTIDRAKDLRKRSTEAETALFKEAEIGRP